MIDIYLYECHSRFTGVEARDAEILCRFQRHRNRVGQGLYSKRNLVRKYVSSTNRIYSIYIIYYIFYNRVAAMKVKTQN